MKKLLVSCAAVGLVFAGAACGDDDSSSSAADYCEISNKLEESSDEAFADLDENSTEDDIAAAMKTFLDDHEDEINDALEAAPDEISSELETLVDAQRELAESGDLAVLETDEATAADEKVQAYDDENCATDTTEE